MFPSSKKSYVLMLPVSRNYYDHSFPRECFFISQDIKSDGEVYKTYLIWDRQENGIDFYEARNEEHAAYLMHTLIHVRSFKVG